jgi:chromate reductase, NAD(P)H dehydrogenase (quinone)
MRMRILAVSGSLRRGSHNTALLRAAAELLPPGVELTMHDGLRDVPPYDEDMLVEQGRPAAAQHLWDEFAVVDGVLISTPEYNRSIPGHLKNALDWMSVPLADSPLRDKPVAVVGASTGIFGAVWAQAETRKVLDAIGASPLDLEYPLPNADEQFHQSGALHDADLQEALVDVLEQLVQAVRQRQQSHAA